MKQELLLSGRWSKAAAQASSSYGIGAAGVARGWCESLLHFVLPARCLSCRAILKRWRPCFGLCEGCLERLEKAPDGQRGAACEGVSQDTHRSYRRLLWGWRYAPPIDAVIQALKFRRLDYLGRQLGHELGVLYAAALTTVDVVTPVPLAWLRRLGRGFDQAEVIASAVAQVCGLPLRSLLVRQRNTRPQSRVPGRAERQLNPVGAFAPTRQLAKSWRGCHILLVDDVATTGATLEAAARCLLEAGAGEVTTLVVARTPAPNEG